MTVAVLLAAAGRGCANETVQPLATALRQAGAAEIHTDAGAELSAQLRRIAALAHSSSAPLLLCGTDVVAHGSVLLTVLTEPGGGSVALVGTAGGAGHDRYAAVREDRNLLSAAWPPPPVRAPVTTGSAGPPPPATTQVTRPATGAFLGVLRIGVQDLPALSACAERLATRRPELPDRRLEPVDGRPEPVDGQPAATAADLLLPALVAAGCRVGACRPRLLVADRAADDAEAAAVRTRMATVDEDAARLRLAVKERDDFFTTYFVSPVSPYAVRWAARAGLTPTGVTAISVALALVAAAGFAWGSRATLVAGAVLLYVSFLLDCVDGQLARYTRRFSAFGGWLDTMADRSKEYLVYAGLAVGAERAGLGAVWPLALAAIVLQTVRHMTDTWYGALHDEAVAGPERGGVGGVLGRASERVQADPGSPAYWLKRIVVFPIGERWALIAVTAALFDGRVTLIAVLACGGFAMAYTLALRSLRSRAMRVAVLSTVDTAAHRDDGPLVRALARGLNRPAMARGLNRPALARGLNRPAPTTGPAGGVARRPGPRPLPMAVLAVAVAGGLLTGAVATAGPPGWPTAAWVLATGVAVPLLAGLPAGVPHDGALDWLVPAALRAAEYLFVVGVGTAYGVPLPLLFALLFALALRHYDLTARMEKHAAAAPARAWDVGWDGRVAVLAVGAAAGAATAVVGLLTGYVLLMFCVGALGARDGARLPAGLVGGRSR